MNNHPNWKYMTVAQRFCATIAWEQVISDYQSGMSPLVKPTALIKQLGKKYGCSSNTIRLRLIEAGVLISRNCSEARKNFPMAQVISEYQSGMSATELGEKYGCSPRP